MSNEALGYVWRYSPYKGSARFVHVAIADSVNDQNDNRFFLRLTKLAEKTGFTRPTVQKAVKQLVEDGFLEVVERRDGRSTIYRFVFIEGLPVTYETRSGGVKHVDTSRRPEGVKELGRGAKEVYRGCKESLQGVSKPLPRNPIEPKDEPNRTQELFAEADDRFGDFWQLWIDAGRNVDRPQARRAWDKALGRADASTIIEAARSYTTSGIEARFMKHPHRWLASDGWDAPPPTRGDERRTTRTPSRDGESGVIQL